MFDQSYHIASHGCIRVGRRVTGFERSAESSRAFAANSGGITSAGGSGIGGAPPECFDEKAMPDYLYSAPSNLAGSGYLPEDMVGERLFVQNECKSSFGTMNLHLSMCKWHSANDLSN